MSPRVVDYDGTEREFPECPDCLAAGEPSCYPWAPRSWYPIDDLPQWHLVWMAFNNMNAATPA